MNAVAKPQYLTLDEAARELRICARTLAVFLTNNPAEPPLFARIGKKYLISPSDLSRIYEAMKFRSASSRATARNTSVCAPPSHASTLLRLQALTTPKRRKGRQARDTAGAPPHGRHTRRRHETWTRVI